MTQYNVTPQYVATAASDCDTTAQDVQTQLGLLRTYVEGLGATWLGVSSAQFAEMMTNFQVYSVALHDALVDIGQGLRGNYVNYVNSEADNLKSLVGIDGNLVDTPNNPSSQPTTLTPVPPPANL
ncbi:MAG TPA: WXG100 family type VII secretion target [Actinocatenispora sp.]